MRYITYRLRLLLMLCFLLGYGNTIKAQRPEREPVSLFTSLAGAASYTGLNAYFNLGLAYKKHRIYAGPKMVLTKSYVPGRTLWGVNAGYYFDLVQQNKWNTSLNLDYQNTWYKSAPVNPHNTLQEITGGLNLNYFAVPGKMSVGLTMGAGMRIENAYNTYTTEKNLYIGAMYQVRLGIIYKLSRR